MSRLVALLPLTALAFGCTDSGLDPEDGAGEGVAYDAENPNGVMDDGKSDAPRYTVPTDLPVLIAPEVIVSLDGLTVHLFDRATGFQAVYPAGVGTKDSRGISITPTGHYRTSANISDTWWFVARRTLPDYFGGFPFLRIDAKNSDGANTYGLHGPITDTLIRGYVSHGCVRMRSDDIIRLFWMTKKFPQMPVTIQKEVEKDAAGRRVDVGMTPRLWGTGEQIPFGASVGTRPW